MALKDWLAEFYPVPANETKRDDAIEHSLRKWEGLRREELKRHGVWRSNGRIVERDGDGQNDFWIDTASCALCFHYLDPDKGGYHAGAACAACPLAAAHGGVPCDMVDDGRQEDESPYDAWAHGGDAEPMIVLLERARKEQEGSGS